MKTGRPDWDAMISAGGIPADEPVFLLRAQNDTAAETVRAWAELELAAGTPIAVVEQALRQADAMDRWPVKKALTADHLTVAKAKQLAYAHSRRVWGRGKLVRESVAAAMMLELIRAIAEAPSTASTMDIKALANRLSAQLASGRNCA
jgi:hypothetical protein